MLRRTVEPAWLSWQESAVYSGLCVQTLRNAEKLGHFQTRVVTLSGRKKGRRLINRESLDTWLWSNASQQAEPSQLQPLHENGSEA